MYVYVLKSCFVEKFYVGVTSNLKERLQKHNDGDCVHTRKFKPWRYKLAIWFQEPDKAIAFEKYLKTHSGRSFSKKHF